MQFKHKLLTHRTTNSQLDCAVAWIKEFFYFV